MTSKGEIEHGLQDGAAKVRIDHQCCGSCPAGCVVQEAKPVPPAVCEYAIGEREQLLARIAELSREVELMKTPQMALEARKADEAEAVKLQRILFSDYRECRPDGEGLMGWAAAALTASAPNHSEQVRDVLPGLELAHDLLWPAGVPVNFIRIIERAMRDARVAAAPSAGSQGGDV